MNIPKTTKSNIFLVFLYKASNFRKEIKLHTNKDALMSQHHEKTNFKVIFFVLIMNNVLNSLDQRQLKLNTINEEATTRAIRECLEKGIAARIVQEVQDYKVLFFHFSAFFI